MSLDVYLKVVQPVAIFQDNVTHNLGPMAKEAGLYHVLWRPEELGITKARELIPHLQAGLHLLRSDPDRFSAFNPSNGWGSYSALVDFVSNYLCACEQHPDAEVEVCR